jgi:hypothetical protein
MDNPKRSESGVYFSMSFSVFKSPPKEWWPDPKCRPWRNPACPVRKRRPALSEAEEGGYIFQRHFLSLNPLQRRGGSVIRDGVGIFCLVVVSRMALKLMLHEIRLDCDAIKNLWYNIVVKLRLLFLKIQNLKLYLYVLSFL